MLITRILGGTAAALAGLAISAQAETWDMPTPYPDATFHTVNITEFAADVAAEVVVIPAKSADFYPECSSQ